MVKKQNGSLTWQRFYRSQLSTSASTDWHNFVWIQYSVYKTKISMENRELERAATVVGMLLLVVTFLMGILDTL